MVGNLKGILGMFCNLAEYVDKVKRLSFPLVCPSLLPLAFALASLGSSPPNGGGVTH